MQSFIYKLTSLAPFVQNLLLNNSFKNFIISLWLKVNFKSKFVYTYYIRNEHLWLDGFLFSERLVFDSVVKLYIDYLIWYMHKFSIFEVSNVFEMLSMVIYASVTIFFIIIIIIVVM